MSLRRYHSTPLLRCFVSPTPLLPISVFVFFLMIRRPPRSTLDRSSAASDVYKRQREYRAKGLAHLMRQQLAVGKGKIGCAGHGRVVGPVSYTHLRAHETVLDLVCRLLLEKKKSKSNPTYTNKYHSDDTDEREIKHACLPDDSCSHIYVSKL